MFKRLFSFAMGTYMYILVLTYIVSHGFSSWSRVNHYTLRPLKNSRMWVAPLSVSRSRQHDSPIMCYLATTLDAVAALYSWFPIKGWCGTRGMNSLESTSRCQRVFWKTYIDEGVIHQ